MMRCHSHCSRSHEEKAYIFQSDQTDTDLAVQGSLSFTVSIPINITFTLWISVSKLSESGDPRP